MNGLPKSSFGRILLVVVLFLSVPLVPFLLFGSPLEERMAAWLRSQNSFASVSLAVLFLLCIDVLLPVPSSVVCTVAGSFLGLFYGTLISALGLSLGAFAGFLLGRFFGRPIVNRWVDPKDLAHLDGLVQKHGVSILVFLRPVPLFAEASTLLLGCSGMNWLVFVVASLPIHLCLAFVYAFLGQRFSLLIGTILSVLIALGLSILARYWTRDRDGA